MASAFESRSLSRTVGHDSPNETQQISPRRPFYRMTRRDGIGYAVFGFSRDCLYRLLDYPHLPLRARPQEIIKAGRSTLLVRAQLPIAGRMVPVAYKRVSRAGWLKHFTALLRPNRALRAFRLAHRLIQNGVPTARPLAVIVPRRTNLRRPAYVVTEWLQETCALDVYCRRLERTHAPARRQALTQAVDAVAHLVGRMHAAGFSHRDLKVANLLLRQREASVEAFVVDLDGMAMRLWLTAARRRQNLARLAADLSHMASITRSLQLRFLKRYLAAAGDSPLAWKRSWRDIARRSRSLTRRKSRYRARWGADDR